MTHHDVGLIFFSSGMSALLFGWLAYGLGFRQGHSEGWLGGRAEVLQEKFGNPRQFEFYDQSEAEAFLADEPNASAP
jgi:hypothetical protein